MAYEGYGSTTKCTTKHLLLVKYRHGYPFAVGVLENQYSIYDSNFDISAKLNNYKSLLKSVIVQKCNQKRKSLLVLVVEKRNNFRLNLSEISLLSAGKEMTQKYLSEIRNQSPSLKLLNYCSLKSKHFRKTISKWKRLTSATEGNCFCALNTISTSIFTDETLSAGFIRALKKFSSAGFGSRFLHEKSIFWLNAAMPSLS